MTRTLTLLSFFAILFVVAGCSKSGNSQPDARTQTSASAQRSGAANVSPVISVETRADNKVPMFSWTDETGKKVTIDEFARGQGVLVNFWATWCGPCKKEIPDLVALSGEYNGKGVKVLGISVDRDGDAVATVSDFVSANSIKYPIVVDNGDLEKAFGGIRGIPTTFFVDKNGMIVKRMIGLQSKAAFAQEMDAVKP